MSPRGSTDEHSHSSGTDRFVDEWPRSFAQAVDGRLVELRLELLREARQWLGEYERSREPELRGRLLVTLEHLALLVRT